MVFGLILAVAGAVPASAQNERGFVRGLGGVTFGTAETSAIYGGGGGLAIGPGLQITGEFGRIEDVLPAELKDALALVSALLSLQLGLPVTFDATAPTYYGLAGVRYSVPRGRLRPFAEAQGGLAHITFDVDATVAGIDVSRELEDEAGIASGDDFLLGLGGGIVVMFTDRVGFEAGYRYGRIFTDDPAININAVYGAIHFSVP
jgi:hypothetical protein